MAYKTLLTIVTNPVMAAQALAPAIAMARREDAHLEVLCLAIDHTQLGYYYPGSAALILQDDITRAEKEAAALEGYVTARLEGEGLRWSVETAMTQLGGLPELISARARFSDLVVLPRPYGKGIPQNADLLVEAALFQGKVPALVVPPSGLPEAFGAPTVGQEVVVAWNQSSEALIAIRAALPLLKTAKRVSIAIIDPSPHGAERSDPGGALSQMLARHGVTAEVSVLARTLPRISDILNRHVRDRAADLVVMGAFGHSRFREWVLGGVTRDMLELSEVPLFLAH